MYIMAVLILGTLSATVSAETAILRGVVSDSSTSELLPAANLVLTSSGFETGTLTTLDGVFEFRNSRLKLTMSIQNLLDMRHREVFGAPKIGRLGILRLQYSI